LRQTHWSEEIHLHNLAHHSRVEIADPRLYFQTGIVNEHIEAALGDDIGGQSLDFVG